MVIAKIVHPKTGYVSEYYIEPRLKKNLDEKIIPMLAKKDKDFVLALDGKEGSGKSTFAFQIGKYIDPSLDLSRVVFDGESFRNVIFKAKKGQVVVFDEAFTGLSSRAALSSVNRALVSLMMQMRQKNLCVIMVLPTFFLLDKYVALFRARALIHVYESSGNRGYFRVYNTNLKKKLYLTGKKDYSYGHKSVRTRFRGRFYGKFVLGDEKTELEYRNKKGKALEATQTNPMTSMQVRFREQRNLILYILRKQTNLTYRELENVLIDYDMDISYQQIAKICGSFGDKDKEEAKEKHLREKKARKLKKMVEKEQKSKEVDG